MYHIHAPLQKTKISRAVTSPSSDSDEAAMLLPWTRALPTGSSGGWREMRSTTFTSSSTSPRGSDSDEEINGGKCACRKGCCIRQRWWPQNQGCWRQWLRWRREWRSKGVTGEVVEKGFGRCKSSVAGVYCNCEKDINLRLNKICSPPTTLVIMN